MKKKVGTVLDEELLTRAKQAAIVQKEPLSRLLEDALRMYLLTVERPSIKKGSVVQDTQGTMKVSPAVLKKIMEEEGVFES